MTGSPAPASRRSNADTLNTLKVESPGPSQSLALNAYLMTLNGGGLLVTGSNAFSISGTAGSTELTAGSPAQAPATT